MANSYGWSVDIQGARVHGLSRKDLKQRLETVLRAEDCPQGYELSVKLTDDNEIAELHSTWMQIEGPTDVLSFPQDDPKAPSAVGGCLGDVVVSTDTARRQAADHGHSLAAEVTLLAVHGVLHLLGYDDLDETKRSLMRQKEQKYVPEAFQPLQEEH